MDAYLEQVNLANDDDDDDDDNGDDITNQTWIGQLDQYARYIVDTWGASKLTLPFVKKILSELFLDSLEESWCKFENMAVWNAMDDANNDAIDTLEGFVVCFFCLFSFDFYNSHFILYRHVDLYATRKKNLSIIDTCSVPKWRSLWNCCLPIILLLLSCTRYSLLKFLSRTVAIPQW